MQENQQVTKKEQYNLNKLRWVYEDVDFYIFYLFYKQLRAFIIYIKLP